VETSGASRYICTIEFNRYPILLNWIARRRPVLPLRRAPDGNRSTLEPARALDYLFGVYPAQEYASGNPRLNNHWQVNVRPHHINYEWDRVCLDAISEKVPRLRTFRIYEALAAIQQRRLSHLGHEENRALTEAEEDIQMVIANHFGKPSRQP
jgi:hypothetical protein